MIDFLGRNISRALPGFTSFTSCDTTAEFMNRGKILCWKAWQECPAVTSAFLFMSSPSPSLPRLKRHMMVLQKYTSRLYGEQADPLVSSSVDKVRLDMIISTTENLGIPYHPVGCSVLQIPACYLSSWPCVGQHAQKGNP